MKSIYRLIGLVLSLSSALAQAAVAQPFAAEIPFHDCRGLICFDVQPDGQAGRTFMLDTGNVNSWMKADAARSLGWMLEPLVQDGKTVPRVYVLKDHHITLGKTTIASNFIAFDTKESGDSSLPADGALAYTFFKDRIVQIDYPRHMLRISPVITDTAAASAAPGKLQLITFGTKGPPILVGSPFRVNGKSVHAQIDTMYTGSLLVYDDALASLGLSKHGNREFFAYTDGGVDMLAAAVPQLGFADVPLLKEKPIMYFVGAGKNPVHQPDGLFEATVGNALFAHSVVTLDFHAMTLNVQPSA